MKASNTLRIVLALAALSAVPLPRAVAADEPWVPYTTIQVKGFTLEMLKHRITVDPSGLPAQIYIKPDPRDLPLEKRRAKVPDAELVAVGRGPQLRAPIRIAGLVDGQERPAIVTSPARPVRVAKGLVEYASKLALGPVLVDLTTRYECDGAVVVKMTYSARGAKVDAVELVMDLAGAVDMAYAGLPASVRPGQIPYDQLDVDVAAGEGVVWDSAKRPAAAKTSGAFVPYLYFGSGDRGFTWLCDSDKGWDLDPKVAAMTLERDKAGQATWRVKFINHAAAVSGARTIEFALLTHPAKAKEKGFRKMQWLAWRADKDRAAGSPKGYQPAGVDGLGATTLAGREKMKQAARQLDGKGAANHMLLGALTGRALESCASDLEMRGAACADVVSRDRDGVAAYPISLFRFMAATSTGLTARVRSNVGDIVGAGDIPTVARSVLGRALLHDIGADLAGLEQPAHFVRLLKALDDFGLFADEETEVIPYWRTRGIVRYGEAFDPGGEFEVTEKDPYAKVHVTVYRRALSDGGRTVGFKAMFVVMNETDSPVRERLMVLKPDRIFGGPNGLKGTEVADKYDFSAIDRAVPGNNDWRKGKVVGTAGYQALQDLEDNGLIKVNTSKGREGELYGPLFVYPHDYRVLYGYARK